MCSMKARPSLSEEKFIVEKSCGKTQTHVKRRICTAHRCVRGRCITEEQRDEIWLSQTPAVERGSPPGYNIWEMQFEGFRATEKKQTQRLWGRWSKHKYSWLWTNMYFGRENSGIDVLTHRCVEYSRTNLKIDFLFEQEV